jgi:hypothetical protein
LSCITENRSHGLKIRSQATVSGIVPVLIIQSLETIHVEIQDGQRRTHRSVNKRHLQILLPVPNVPENTERFALASGAELLF